MKALFSRIRKIANRIFFLAVRILLALLIIGSGALSTLFILFSFFPCLC